MSMTRRSILCIAAAAFLAASCNDDPSRPIEGGGDPENISRVSISLTSGGVTTTSTRVDPDGTQGSLPVGAAQGTLSLTRGTTYTGTISLKNDLDPNNVVDITAEVTKEANFHRLFYTFSCGGATVPESSMNLDTQSPTQYPLGTSFQVTVAATAATTSSCTLHVELHHFETAKGNGLGSVFDTDLSLDFPVTIQ